MNLKHHQRTGIPQTHLKSEEVIATMSDAGFVPARQLHVSISVVCGFEDLQVTPVLELFNRASQFNTLCEGYTLEQVQELFAAGDELYVAEAPVGSGEQRLVGMAWLRGNTVTHMVVSDHALGLGIEAALLGCIAGRLGQRNEMVMNGRLRVTGTNAACQEFFRRNGFIQLPNKPAWSARSLAVPVAIPAHIALNGPADEVDPALDAASDVQDIAPGFQPAIKATQFVFSIGG